MALEVRFSHRFLFWGATQNCAELLRIKELIACKLTSVECGLKFYPEHKKQGVTNCKRLCLRCRGEGCMASWSSKNHQERRALKIIMNLSI